MLTILFGSYVSMESSWYEAHRDPSFCVPCVNRIIRLKIIASESETGEHPWPTLSMHDTWSVLFDWKSWYQGVRPGNTMAHSVYLRYAQSYYPIGNSQYRRVRPENTHGPLCLFTIPESYYLMVNSRYRRVRPENTYSPLCLFTMPESYYPMVNSRYRRVGPENTYSPLCLFTICESNCSTTVNGIKI